MNKNFVPSPESRKVLQYLRDNYGMTTRDGYDLNILSPAKCIQELRNAGYSIETIYRHSIDRKRYGVYVLHENEGGEQNAKM